MNNLSIMMMAWLGTDHVLPINSMLIFTLQQFAIIINILFHDSTLTERFRQHSRRSIASWWQVLAGVVRYRTSWDVSQSEDTQSSMYQGGIMRARSYKDRRNQDGGVVFFPISPTFTYKARSSQKLTTPKRSAKPWRCLVPASSASLFPTWSSVTTMQPLSSDPWKLINLWPT